MLEPFRLWQPTITSAGDWSDVAFDVCTTGIKELADGSFVLVGGFLDALALPIFALRSWSVAAFRTPYYSDYPEESWEDRYRQTWRVTAEVKLPADTANPALLTPVAAGGTDPAFSPLAWDKPLISRCDTVIIGCEVSRDPQPVNAHHAAAELGAGEVRSYPITGGGWIHQLRLQLGVLDLADSPAVADAASAILKHHGLALDWRAAHLRATQLDLT